MGGTGPFLEVHQGASQPVDGFSDAANRQMQAQSGWDSVGLVTTKRETAIGGGRHLNLPVGGQV